MRDWLLRGRLAIPHVALIAVTFLYTLLGAAAFYCVERPHELEHRRIHQHRIRSAQEALIHVDVEATNETMEYLIDELIKITFVAFANGIDLLDLNDTTDLKWNFPSSIFFATTVLTSVG